jgi:hypothetical protein
MAPSQAIIHAEIGLLITRIGRLWRREVRKIAMTGCADCRETLGVEADRDR